MRRVKRPCDLESVAGAVEEVRIGKADVARPGGHDLVDIGEHGRDRDRARAAPVDARHRAVPAAVVAAAACFHAGRRDRGAALEQAGVVRERWEAPPERSGARSGSRRGGGRRGRRAEIDRDAWQPLVAGGAGACQPVEEGRHRVTCYEEVTGAEELASFEHLCVETVAGKRQSRLLRPQAPDDSESQPRGGVHRDGHHSSLRPHDCFVRPTGLGEIDAAGLVAGGLEGSGRSGYPERLMAELVGGKEKDPHVPNVTAARRWPAESCGQMFLRVR